MVAYPNTGGRPLGAFSQSLLMDARGEYVSFVDDDDWVLPDFVSAVTDRMLSGPDIVGFENEYSENGVPHRNSFILRHSYGMNGCKAPPGVNPARCRDITHVTPIKTVLAQRGDFRSGWPSDYHWAQGCATCTCRPKSSYRGCCIPIGSGLTIRSRWGRSRVLPLPAW